MCGFCGIVGPARAAATDAIGAMTDTIAHRGPDDAGTHVERFAVRGDEHALAFGHRRLSILDLSPLGHQPMASADGTLVIAYNGEVYNFRELRRELEALGTSFRSDCDTEVLLEAYRAWGTDSLRSLHRHVRLRALGPTARAPGPRARPARHQAALLRLPRRRCCCSDPSCARCARIPASAPRSRAARSDATCATAIRCGAGDDLSRRAPAAARLVSSSGRTARSRRMRTGVSSTAIRRRPPAQLRSGRWTRSTRCSATRSSGA